MNSQIRQPVTDVWHHHLGTLEEALDESIRGLQNLLRLDEYHRHGHEQPKLKESLGPFGSSTLDLSALSDVLGSSGRLIPKERLERISQLLDDLQKLHKYCQSTPNKLPYADLEEDEAVIHQKAEKHLNEMARIFANLRIAQLEIHSKYKDAEHGPVFKEFTWRTLNPTELSVCPPFIVNAEIGSDSGPVLRKIMSLLESRKPIKVVAMRSTLKKTYSPTSDPSVPATLAIEMIPVAMRGVYFLQSSVAAHDFHNRLFEGLTSPRPTLLSILAQKKGEDGPVFQLRAQKAVRSRAFPAVVYNPDVARGFVTCFNLSANPEGPTDFNFAHFAAEEKDFAKEFSIPPDGTDPRNLVPVSAYLELTRRQRIGKLPSVTITGEDGSESTLLVSQSIVTQMSDQIHLWKTLQELAGVDNPFVMDTKATLTAEFGAKQKALLEHQQEELKKDSSHREQVAVASAVQRIVSHFTGVDASEIDIQKLLATVAENPGQ
ncbi:hypothetical protein G0Q06_09095 [Puniceicoccales bacterium CK1056]|uniref:Uncharacterized protein n=1 Tax=Oceanipulchritudo coccoides TaxID=2706888 RepID=A0A6B2M449_9BACT|nr:hypothetical protein [Oceanipulchritudo coccoides]NDV62605.1 hypothetical protein [Oceanipulchritudo coccoides]